MATDTSLSPLSADPRAASARTASRLRTIVGAVGLALALTAAAPASAQQGSNAAPGDHIVAIVNQELVTAVEWERRTEALRQAAARAGQPVQPTSAWRQQALEDLINERVVVTYAREFGGRVDDVEVDRAVNNVAAQNQLSQAQLVDALRAQGLDMARFRADLRDQILVERVREREVVARINVSEEEVDRELTTRQAASLARDELNLAQILVPVPDGADAATVEALRARAQQALARVNAGEAFDAVAREVSQDDNRERGGEIGLRPADRLPDVFVQAVAGLTAGQVRPALLRSGAGFHVLKLLERRAAADSGLVETRARHVLLRVSPQASAEQAAARLRTLKRDIESGARRFEDVAREVSEDGSAAQGGDLGWFPPGAMVPEFEQPAAELAEGAVSDPVRSRFGVHLIQVLDRRPLVLTDAQKREQVRNALRERKFATAYDDWVAELRARAYVELRAADLT